MTSPMWNAFIQNQKYTDKEADDIEIAKQQFQQNRMNDAYKQFSKSQNISEYMNIPSNITSKDTNETTKSHPYFKNYDHSLERIRTTDDMIAPEPEPEGLRLCPRGIPITIDTDETVDTNDLPDLSIDWDSIGKQLGLWMFSYIFS